MPWLKSRNQAPSLNSRDRRSGPLELVVGVAFAACAAALSASLRSAAPRSASSCDRLSRSFALRDGTNKLLPLQSWPLAWWPDGSVKWSAHAIAPGAHILLVEADSNSFTNLLAAEDYAKAHAQYVSNSWSGGEFSGESSYDSHFLQSGVSFFFSSGDSGLPAEYPSASPNVA